VVRLVVGGAAAWPLAARGQQSGRLPIIGLLGVGTATGWVHFTGAFVQRLRELGWIEGRTVAIEYRWAEGRRDRFSEIAAEFVGLKVDVIVTGGDAAAAARQVTSVIPIVFALGLDPLGSGLVANLARPSGNVTGLSFQSVDIAGKRVELLHEIAPDVRRLAILANVGNPQSMLEMGAAQAAARMLGLKVATFEFRGSEDIVPTFDALNGRVDAIYVCGDALVFIYRNRINTLSVGLHLPTVHVAREFIEAGGLISYGPSMRPSSGARPNLSIRFCVGRSRPISPWSSRPSSNSSST
jgi:putative ABC transport system substrate-binding protein